MQCDSMLAWKLVVWLRKAAGGPKLGELKLFAGGIIRLIGPDGSM